MAGGAGGPKGLILGPMDRFIFGDWLPRSSQSIDLVGVSIGAWRLATACMVHPAEALKKFERNYLEQDFDLQSDDRKPRASLVTERFAAELGDFFGDRIDEILKNPRFRLHVFTSRGRRFLSEKGRLKTAVGYLLAYGFNCVRRKCLGLWFERCVFSSNGAALPFGEDDLHTRQIELNESNFLLALRASCSIPFLLDPVRDIPDGAAGAYWDGGITDYHLHLAYRAEGHGLVLCPHFHKALIPGWFDKALRWRHATSTNLDRMVVMAPDPDWVRSLPNGKLPDRDDFFRYAGDARARMQIWGRAVAESQRLADELAERLNGDDVGEILPL